ncbi:MFS transporter, partial [Actinophytocola sp.]|uniref:MFS transporter n=1 Tax=Actinophytocola sp. TaxID=1872138 RepID=UPI003899A689
LAVTPFSLGSAVSAWISGRLVSRYGRWVTIAGLTLMIVGLTAVGVLGFVVDRDALVLVIALPLLVAGVGGGAVISPNTTLTLASVPPEMSGVASGVLQTGQRLGGAVGTALLAAVFYAATAALGAGASGFSVAMFSAVILILLAFAVAIWEYRSNHESGSLENYPTESVVHGQ